MCAGEGRVIITDISVADWPPYGRLIEFNKECFFNDYITRVTIRRAEGSYSVESCSVASRTNKEARIGCTTDTTRKEAKAAQSGASEFQVDQTRMPYSGK